MVKKVLTIIGGWMLVIIFFAIVLLLCSNPGRGSFNNAVFDGGTPNPITSNQAVMDSIIEVNCNCYQNENDQRVKRNNYIIFSIYDVQVSNKTYHLLGILGIFRLLNP